MEFYMELRVDKYDTDFKTIAIPASLADETEYHVTLYVYEAPGATLREIKPLSTLRFTKTEDHNGQHRYIVRLKLDRYKAIPNLTYQEFEDILANDLVMEVFDIIGYTDTKMDYEVLSSVQFYNALKQNLHLVTYEVIYQKLKEQLYELVYGK